MGSWVRTITSPFRKSCIFLHDHHNQQPQPQPQPHHQQPQQPQQRRRDKKSKPAALKNQGLDLHSEVMACAYEDVQVMWSMLDKSKPGPCQISS